MNPGSPVEESFNRINTMAPYYSMNDSSARESSCPPTILYEEPTTADSTMPLRFPNSYCPPSLRAKILSHTQPYPTFLKAHLEQDSRSRSVPPVRIRLRTANMSPTRSTKSDAAASFPLLKQLGWTPHHILGDGNCLFRALSHQVHGHDQLHRQLRTEVIAQFRREKNVLLPFMAADLRRSSRRTRGRQPAGLPTTSSATQEELFEQRIALMEKDHTWGDHLEIQTFCNLKHCNVVIFQEGAPMITVQPRGTADSSDLPTYYLAYHQHEHYSSIKHRSQNVALPKTMSAFDTERGMGATPTTPALTLDNGSDNSTSTPVESESEHLTTASIKRKRGYQFHQLHDSCPDELLRLSPDEECKLKRIKLRVKEPYSQMADAATLGTRLCPVPID